MTAILNAGFALTSPEKLLNKTDVCSPLQSHLIRISEGWDLGKVFVLISIIIEVKHTHREERRYINAQPKELPQDELNCVTVTLIKGTSPESYKAGPHTLF